MTNPRPHPGGKSPVLAGLALWLVLLLAASSALAHPVSIVDIQALVHRDRMDMQIAIMPEDFLLIYGLYANSDSRIAVDDIVKSAQKHKQYLLEGLIVRDADGNRLSGKVVKVDVPALPPEGLPVTDLMATTIVYHLEFLLAKPPTHLSFQQHFGGDAFAMPAIVNLEVTREGLAPEPLVRVPGDENVATIAFDWNEKFRPVTGDYAEEKARERARSKQDLGISSYSATYTFVYIQDEEVRVEILMPLLTLEMWQPVARTNSDFLEVPEQRAARSPLEAFFTSQNALKIDGVLVKPTLERLDFYGVDFKDFAMRAQPHRLSAWTARVGAILTYSTKGAPGHVELRWTLFNNEMLAARAVVFAYNKGLRFTFSQQNPVFKWDNPGSPPLPAVTAISTQETSRTEVAKSLLRNVYRAFDYRNESDIYDALARSVHGDLLADLYLKIKQGLIMQEQGGAVARVKEVRIIKVEPEPTQGGSGFAQSVTWQVEGTVEHWGHIHLRVNEYAADLQIEPVDGSWKITALNVSRQKLIKSAVLLRQL